MVSKKAVLLSITIVAVLSISAFSFYLQTEVVPNPHVNAELGINVSPYSFHVSVYLQRADEDESTFWSHHAGVLTTIGKNFIEGKLGDSTYTNNTKFADAISVSTDSGSPAAGWTSIPNEITSGGLDRNTGTYSSTGDGQWTIEYQFTATTTHTDVQLTGLQWDPTDGSGNDLLAADTFTPVTLNNNDKITVTWTITVS